MKSSALAIAIAAALTVGIGFTSAASAETGQHKVEKVQRDNGDIRRDHRGAIEHGNVKAAEKWDQQRQAEQHETNADKKDIRRDERDLNRDRADRNADVQQRNRDASGL